METQSHVKLKHKSINELKCFALDQEVLFQMLGPELGRLLCSFTLTVMAENKTLFNDPCDTECKENKFTGLPFGRWPHCWCTHLRIEFSALLIIVIDFFICRGPVHKERRNYLRTALKEMSLILSDQPGLLGPKVEAYFFHIILPVSLNIEYWCT